MAHFFNRTSDDRRTFDRSRCSSGEAHSHGEGLLDKACQTLHDPHLLFVGSVNCLRHKPYLGIGQKMAEGTASVLCPSMSDFSSGRYVTQVYDAVVQLSEERNTKEFVIAFGCQWVILSTDGELLLRRLKEEHGINAVLYDDSHLENGDHH